MQWVAETIRYCTKSLSSQDFILYMELAIC